MSNPKWKLTSASDGIFVYRLSSWSSFYEFLETEFSDSSDFLWRGHRNSDWSLATTFDRLVDRLGISAEDAVKLASRHLESFKYAARGRRGLNPPVLSENEWWALGQHFGLATPLLDWTRSPFAAAYFAFENLVPKQTKFRTMYALSEYMVDAKNLEIDEGPAKEGRPPVVEIVNPLSDENPRLVNQGGVFTKSPIGLSLENWISAEFEGTSRRVLMRIEIPDSDRLPCLRALNRMNINHLSLFPDLTGASRFTNLKWEFTH